MLDCHRGRTLLRSSSSVTIAIIWIVQQYLDKFSGSCSCRGRALWEESSTMKDLEEIFSMEMVLLRDIACKICH